MKRMSPGLVIVDERGGRLGPIALNPTIPNGATTTVTTRMTEPGDPGEPFRMALHPWDGGLAFDRIQNRRSYAKGNGEFSNVGLATFPPKLNLRTFSTGTGPTQTLDFAGKQFFLCGRYMWTVASDGTAAQDKDFGASKAGVAMAVFNNELIVAMGETEKIHKRTSGGTWSQASDAVYAIALCVVGKYLWRAETTNLLSNCLTTPFTLTNWLPSSNSSKQVVSDTTYAVHTLKEYNGAVWAFKGDGAYQADASGRFYNQTPQVVLNPHPDNCKGVFIAQGAIFVPFAGGMVRVQQGRSLPVGPELSWRPDFRFWVRGGVEWGGAIYLLCTDEAAVEATCVVKMKRDERNLSQFNEYLYHELVRAPGATKGYAIGASAVATNPRIFFGYGNNAYDFKLGRGGGRDIDDPNYEYGTGLSLETGPVMLGEDIGIVSQLLGIQTVMNFNRPGDSLTVQAAYDSDAWVSLSSSQENGGSIAIENTDGWEAIMRFAPPDGVLSGQFLNVKYTGTLVTAASGTTRCELREAYAIGLVRPKTTDIIKVTIIASRGARWPFGGGTNGLDPEGLYEQLHWWMKTQIPLLIELPDYDPRHPVRVAVTGVSMGDAPTQARDVLSGDQVAVSKQLTVEFFRLDFAGREYGKVQLA